MGFISSSSTVTVKAKLTAAGRKKLFDSLETLNEQFITKFSLGDSDTYYPSVESGNGILPSGKVPEPGEFQPKIRSYVLAEGKYRPAVAHLLVDGRYGGAEGHYKVFPIGQNKPREQVFKIETEWPKTHRYEEDYDITKDMSGLPSGVDIDKYFNVEYQGDGIKLTFNGDVPPDILNQIIGSDGESNNGWTIQFRIEGQESAAVTVLNVDFIQ